MQAKRSALCVVCRTCGWSGLLTGGHDGLAPIVVHEQLSDGSVSCTAKMSLWTNLPLKLFR